MPQSETTFPLWIELAGLPRLVTDSGKVPYAWAVFKKIAELDCAANSRPGTVEVSLDELGARTGLTAEQVVKAAKRLRKAGVLRAFLPDTPEETALFQIITPLPVPDSWEAVRDRTPELRALGPEHFRYALACEETTALKSREDDPKLREVVDLYFNTVSMKMNAFILDELRLISSRFDLDLIRKVFARARQHEVQTLGWILREVRRERDVKEKAKKARELAAPHRTG